MGAHSVAYHRDTVLDRADDHPGQALAYYGSRGETPMRWGGAGAERLGLSGTITHETYGALFADGGARDPVLGTRLVATKRPGLELVVSAHKSVAVLGVVARADDMHRILDAETGATMEFLDGWACRQGNRRGRLQVRTPTSGLIYGRTRHATSRAGDPNPHDHVLIANVTEMLDERGGWKALDTAGVRDMVHAATNVGRLHAAWEARQLGYSITPDHGPSGKLDHWSISGVPTPVCELFSKRSDQIDEVAGADASYRLRSRMARSHRPPKDERAPEQLMERWHSELASLGHSPASILSGVRSGAPTRWPDPHLTDTERSQLVGSVLSPDGPLAADKQFGRADVIRHVAPKLYGRHPDELEPVVTAVLAHPEALPLVGRPGARNRSWVLASTRQAEQAIADCALRLADDDTAPRLDAARVMAAIGRKQRDLRLPFTDGQRDLVVGAATSPRRLELVLGVAGAGKTTALDALRNAYESAGLRVIGTATSGQAACTLQTAAGIESSTAASVVWRLSHGKLELDHSTVVVIDEGGMVDDPTMLRLLTAAEISGSKVIIVGDHHQLGAVGPGGGLEALLDRHAEAVHTLDENIRQHEPAERAALEALRSGDTTSAVGHYQQHGRIDHHAERSDALASTVEAWSTDLTKGVDSVMLAWRRADVGALNQLARRRRMADGHLGTEAVSVDGGREFAVGDWVVALSPDPDRCYVTSQRGTVTSVNAPTCSAIVHFDGAEQPVALQGDALGADRLDHAYAVTVHRAQGSTVDRTHVYADGGGAELAYVACSRARDTTTIHCVADDIDQAVEDLERDWSSERRQRWILDTDDPAAPGQRTRPTLLPRAETGLRLGRLRAERVAVLATIPVDPHAEIAQRRVQRRQLAEQLEDLQAGRGRYAGTQVGDIARQRTEALRDFETARTRAAASTRRQARRLEPSLDEKHEALRIAQRRWSAAVQPVEHGLVDDLHCVDSELAELEARTFTRATWQLQHPDVMERLAALNHEIAMLESNAGIAAPGLAVGRPSPSTSARGLAR